MLAVGIIVHFFGDLTVMVWSMLPQASTRIGTFAMFIATGLLADPGHRRGPFVLAEDYLTVTCVRPS